MKHYTKILSEYVYSLCYSRLPAEARKATKLLVCDWFSACFAGMRANGEFSRAVLEVLTENGGRAEATVLPGKSGELVKLSAREAAMMNAVYAHGADMDDGNKKAMGHVGAHVISAVFALAESMANADAQGVDGKRIIVAINAGYEIYNRISAATQPGQVRRGFHSTGTAGAIACAAACAKLRGLSENQIYNAMSIAAVQSGGLLVIAESGQCCKPLNPANAAGIGLFSASLAGKGVQAPSYPLESDKGWFHAMSDTVNETYITEGLGEHFTVCDCYVKPYPSCRHTHGAIEAAQIIRRRITEEGKSLNSSSVSAIKVNIYKNAIDVAGRIKAPENDGDTKFSLHYAVVSALLRGDFGFNELSISSLNEGVRSLIAKTELSEDNSLEDTAAGVRGTAVSVKLTDGCEYRETVLVPRGEAEKPFERKDAEAKLAQCAEGFLSADAQRGLIEKVFSLDDGAFCGLSDYFLS